MDVLNNDAINRIANMILNQDVAEPVLYCALFVNDETVTVASAFTDFDEPTAAGYAAFELNPADWTISTVAGICNAVYDQFSFVLTNNGDNETIYGHLIFDYTTAEILWGQNWDTPFVIPANGATITISPSWQDSQCLSPSGSASPERRAGRDRVPKLRRK